MKNCVFIYIKHFAGNIANKYLIFIEIIYIIDLDIEYNILYLMDYLTTIYKISIFFDDILFCL